MRTFIQPDQPKRKASFSTVVQTCAIFQITSLVTYPISLTIKAIMTRGSTWLSVPFFQSARAHYGSEQLEKPDINIPLSNELGGGWASERTKERSGARERSEQCGASEWVRGSVAVTNESSIESERFSFRFRGTNEIAFRWAKIHEICFTIHYLFMLI